MFAPELIGSVKKKRYSDLQTFIQARGMSAGLNRTEVGHGVENARSTLAQLLRGSTMPDFLAMPNRILRLLQRPRLRFGNGLLGLWLLGDEEHRRQYSGKAHEEKDDSEGAPSLNGPDAADDDQVEGDGEDVEEPDELHDLHP